MSVEEAQAVCDAADEEADAAAEAMCKGEPGAPQRYRRACEARHDAYLALERATIAAWRLDHPGASAPGTPAEEAP